MERFFPVEFILTGHGFWALGINGLEFLGDENQDFLHPPFINLPLNLCCGLGDGIITLGAGDQLNV